MKIYHTGLKNRWSKLTIHQQMSNIGAEVGRAINWKNKNKLELSKNAFYRALELIDFSVEDLKNKRLLKEILRLRELLVDYLAGENIYRSSDKGWDKYFYPFNFAARN